MLNRTGSRTLMGLSPRYVRQFDAHSTSARPFGRHTAEAPAILILA